MRLTKMAAFVHVELHDGVVLCQLVNKALLSEGISEIKLPDGRTEHANGMVDGQPRHLHEAERNQVRARNIQASLLGGVLSFEQVRATGGAHRARGARGDR